MSFQLPANKKMPISSDVGTLALTAGAVLKVKDNCCLRSQESLNVLNLFPQL